MQKIIRKKAKYYLEGVEIFVYHQRLSSRMTYYSAPAQKHSLF